MRLDLESLKVVEAGTGGTLAELLGPGGGSPCCENTRLFNGLGERKEEKNKTQRQNNEGMLVFEPDW